MPVVEQWRRSRGVARFADCWVCWRPAPVSPQPNALLGIAVVCRAAVLAAPRSNRQAVADGDIVWSEWHWQGMQSGGTPLDIVGVFVCGVREGRISCATHGTFTLLAVGIGWPLYPRAIKGSGPGQPSTA
jgi:hypothetical protein